MHRWHANHRSFPRARGLHAFPRCHLCGAIKSSRGYYRGQMQLRCLCNGIHQRVQLLQGIGGLYSQHTSKLCSWFPSYESVAIMWWGFSTQRCCRPPETPGTWSGSQAAPQAAQQQPWQPNSVWPLWVATQVHTCSPSHAGADAIHQRILLQRGHMRSYYILDWLSPDPL